MRPRTYVLYEIQQKGQKQEQYEIGRAIPFSQGYGFTLFIGDDITLIMYPASDYSRSKRKFNVLAAEDHAQGRSRTHIGCGWRSDYGHVYTVTLRDDSGGVIMKLKMLPKQVKSLQQAA